MTQTPFFLRVYSYCACDICTGIKKDYIIMPSFLITTGIHDVHCLTKIANTRTQPNFRELYCYPFAFAFSLYVVFRGLLGHIRDKLA